MRRRFDLCSTKSPTMGGMMPERIQLRRTAGWRMPTGAVKCARPSRYGNPFRTRQHGIVNADEAIAMHRVMVEYLFKNDAEWRRRFLSDLRGRDLACFCRLEFDCHVDTLLELANA